MIWDFTVCLLAAALCLHLLVAVLIVRILVIKTKTSENLRKFDSFVNISESHWNVCHLFPELQLLIHGYPNSERSSTAM